MNIHEMICAWLWWKCVWFCVDIFAI
jgi:hypothetical protein